MASYQQQKQIESGFAEISSPATSGSDTLGTLQLIKKLGIGTPEVKAAFAKILDNETRFMGAAALAVANNSAFSSKVGSGMAGVFRCCLCNIFIVTVIFNCFLYSRWQWFLFLIISRK